MARKPRNIPCSHTTRAGRPCRAWAVHGTDPPACSAHAGRNVGAGARPGNQNARTHSFYGRFLSEHGVNYCGDMEKLPISVLSRRFGNLGRRIWYMCQGADPDPLHPDVAAPKSIGHGKVMPPNTRNRDVLLTYLQHMCSKVGARMRRHEMEAKTFWIGLRIEGGWLGSKSQLAEFSNDQQKIYQLGRRIIDLYWKGEGIHQIQVTALDPQPAAMQMDLFSTREDENLHQQLNRAMDSINERYGELTLSPACLLNRSETPNVIAPAWKPDGLRQTI